MEPTEIIHEPKSGFAAIPSQGAQSQTTVRKPLTASVALRGGAFILLTIGAYFYRTSIRDAIGGALGMGWPFLVTLPLFIAWSLPAVMAWRTLLAVTPRIAMPSVARLLIVRTEAFAVSVTFPTGGFGGDVLRATFTQSGEGLQSSAPPVVLDRVASSIAEVVFACVGLTVFIASAAAPTWRTLASLLAVIVLLTLLLSWRSVVSVMAGVPWLQHNAGLRRTFSVLLANTSYRHALHRAVGWHLMERVLMVSEIWIISYLLGITLGLVDVVFAGSLVTLFTLVFFFMPAQAGAFEGALALSFSILNLPLAAGLSVAVVHRGRQLIIAAAGLLLLVWDRRRGS